MLFRWGTPLDAWEDNPFSDDVDDLICELICDVSWEGVPPFLAEMAVPISALAEDAYPA